MGSKRGHGLLFKEQSNGIALKALRKGHNPLSDFIVEQQASIVRAPALLNTLQYKKRVLSFVQPLFYMIFDKGEPAPLPFSVRVDLFTTTKKGSFLNNRRHQFVAVGKESVPL
jgi:hypothetical protein